MVWYGMVWYGMVWYGMVWYGMVWYGMVWYGIPTSMLVVPNDVELLAWLLFGLSGLHATLELVRHWTHLPHDVTSILKHASDR